MFGPHPLEEFAEYTHVDADEIERYRAHGLLDSDSDERFDGRDLLKLQFIRAEARPERSPEQILDALVSSSNPLVRRLFRGRDALTVEQAAERMGVTTEQLTSLRNALGFSPHDLMDTEDIESLSGGAGLVAAGLPWEGILEGARVYADSLRRLALANTNMTHRFFCLPFQQQGLSESEISERLGDAVDLLAPASQALVNHLLLDYMREALIEHSISHLVPPSPDLPDGAERATIVFADLALFSTIAELQGDEVAFGLIDRTDSAIRELLVRHQGRLVKQIGDEFMLMFEDPVKAIRFASDLQGHLSQRERHAAARIGMHTGTVIYRLGDYYGRAVNVASRIASMAMPNAILVTEPMAKAASDEGIDVEEIGVRSLRGMEEPVSLFRVLPD